MLKQIHWPMPKITRQLFMVVAALEDKDKYLCVCQGQKGVGWGRDDDRV